MTRLMAVSDVSLDYGSPEVPAIFALLCELTGLRGLLLEPDEADRPVPLARPDRGFAIERVPATTPSQSLGWRREFLAAARARIDREQPDILVLFGGVAFQLVGVLDARPRRVIYHAYEQIADLDREDQEAHQAWLSDVDLVIAPEPRRLAQDCAMLGVWPRRVAHVLNSADVAWPEAPAVRAANERNGRFFWSGAIDRRRTFADYLWSDELAAFGVDLFGRISDPETARVEDVITTRPNLRRRGLAPAAELNAERASFAFSLVWWNPANSFGHLHLCSNRFFTSICAGVPPVCGPHPQCATIARRHDCGIVLEDFSLASVAKGMAEASAIHGTPRYAEMVRNCLDAAASTIGWPAQATALSRVLAEVVA